MELRLLSKFLGALLIILTSALSQAAQFSVKDVSGAVVSCTSPLLQAASTGATCIKFAQNTLQLTVTTDATEFDIQCNERFCAPGYDLYIIGTYKGKNYIYSNASPAWQLLPANIASIRPTFPWQLPFSAQTFSGTTQYSNTFQLNLEDSYDDYLPAGLPLAEIEVYALTAPVGKKIFPSSSVKKIWPKP